MTGASARARRARARSGLSAAKKKAFASKMRALKKNGRRGYRRNNTPEQFDRAAARHENAWAPATPRRRAAKKTKKSTRTYNQYDRFIPKSATPAQRAEAKASIDRYRASQGLKPLKTRATKKTRRRTKAAKKATRKTPMARKVRRRKKSAARSTPKRRVAKRRTVKRRRKAAKRSAVAPKRRKRRKSRKTTLKANKRRTRRRLKKNYGTSAGARKGWRTRRAGKRKAAPKRRRRARKASAVAPKRRRRSAKRRTARRGKRKLSMKKSAVAARRRRRALAKGGAPRKRRRSRRKMATNRRRRSHRRHASNPRRRRRSRARMSSNRRGHRRSHRKNRRHRRNGRRMFRKNGIGDSLMFIAKTGGIALLGFVGHKVLTNVLVTNIMSKIFSTPATAVATPSGTAVTPPTAGLSGISLAAPYQQLLGAGLVAGLGVFAAAKMIKDPGTRNTVMTGIAVSFTTSLLTAVLTKYAPTHAGMLSGDGTAARLSAMYGLGAGTSLQPRYSSIGRPMGEYFSSGVNGLGEYFSSGVSGLGEYFSSGVSGLGLPAYEAAAGYGANPDFAEAAAGMGAREATNTNHVDPHGDLDRELTIAEAAAGVGALPSYEAAAGFGDVSTLPSADTWIPGTSNGQIWAGTRSISAPQSASEMVPAGILQTDGGQGVFG
jgi:hypothetical protein